VTPPTVLRSGVVRTARKLFDGTVFPRWRQSECLPRRRSERAQRFLLLSGICH
jgi:hypothetical protein